MNIILREAFVKLHSNDIMAGLKTEFEERYKGFRTLATIPADSECAQEIKVIRKEYCKIGLTMLQDLQWEMNRWTLLNSANPSDRARGEQMVTPSVVLERHGLLNNDSVSGYAETVKGASGEGEEEEGDGVSDVPEDPGEVEPTSMERGTEILDVLDEGAKCEDIEVEEPSNDNAPIGGGGKAGRRKRVRQDKVITIWVELRFPPIPPKVSQVAHHNMESLEARSTNEDLFRANSMSRISRTVNTSFLEFE
jgi:DNA-directed RNA polymerase